MNAIEEFTTSFLSLNLHAVNISIWKKTLSLTFFKLITVSRSSTLLRVFLMVDQDVRLREGIKGVSQQAKKFVLSPSVGYYPHQKIESPYPLNTVHTYIGKKKACLRHAFSVTQSWHIWKSSLELNRLIQYSVEQD